MNKAIIDNSNKMQNTYNVREIVCFHFLIVVIINVCIFQIKPAVKQKHSKIATAAQYSDRHQKTSDFVLTLERHRPESADDLDESDNRRGDQRRQSLFL